MAYVAVPTRTTADDNSSADINQLQANHAATLGGAAPWDEVASPGTPATDKWHLYFKSDGKLYKKSDAGVETEGGGGGLPGSGILFDASAGNELWFPATNPAKLDTDVGSNFTWGMKRIGFDDTTDQYVYGAFQLYPSLTGYTTVNVQAVGYAVTAAASKTILLGFGFGATNSGEVWDAVGSPITADVTTPDDTQDKRLYITWQAFSIPATWDASAVVLFYIRKVNAGSDLVGDFALTNFRVWLS